MHPNGNRPPATPATPDLVGIMKEMFVGLRPAASSVPDATILARAELTSAIRQCEALMLALVSARDSHEVSQFIDAADGLHEAVQRCDVIRAACDRAWVQVQRESEARVHAREMGVVA